MRLLRQQFGIRWWARLSGSGADTDRTETEFHSVLQDLRCVIVLSQTQTTTRGDTSPGFARHQETSAFALGLLQQIAFAQPSKRACEVASPQFRSQSSTFVVMTAHRELCLRLTSREPVRPLPTLLFATIRHATVLPRTSLLPSQARFVQVASRP